MKRYLRLASVAGILLLLAASGGIAGEMKSKLSIDGSNLQPLQTMFGTYGTLPQRSVSLATGGLRIWMPAGAKEALPTGVYSYFALAGDCEVSFAYDLLKLPASRNGSGPGVGLAFDAEGGSITAAIQRVHRTPGGNGYAFQSTVKGAGGKDQHEDRFLPATSARGRIGLRRIGKDLIYLASPTPTAPLQEMHRTPFTRGAIRVVRFFADPGGSPNGVDVRLMAIDMRGEEISAGVTQIDQQVWGSWWKWLFLLGIGGAVSFWRWQAYRVRSEEEAEAAA